MLGIFEEFAEIASPSKIWVKLLLKNRIYIKFNILHDKVDDGAPDGENHENAVVWGRSLQVLWHLGI